MPREKVMVIASHTHTGPVVAGGLKMFDLHGKEAEVVEAYAKRLREHAWHAASAAVQDLRTAKLSFSRARASFTTNRRVFRQNGVNFGANPDGPVDPEVPVLGIDDAGGTIRAIVFGYACHTKGASGEGAGRVCQPCSRALVHT